MIALKAHIAMKVERESKYDLSSNSKVRPITNTSSPSNREGETKLTQGRRGRAFQM